MTNPTDYREQTLEAKSWRRAHSLMIHNPLPGQGTPTIAFNEHDVVRIGDKLLTSPAMDNGPAALMVAFDPAVSIPLLNPETGEAVGTISHAEIYAALHSAYIAAALARDARIAEEVAAAAPASGPANSDPPSAP